MGAAAIEVQGLRVERGGRPVLREVSLTVARGSLVGLLGPSGCGKTTLMRALVGVQIVQGGAIEILGLPAGDERLRHQVAYLTQDPSVYGDLTVRENLAYFATVLGAPRGDVDRVIAEVGLESCADQRTDRLSGGQRARVSLATALLGDPQVLVLDEPTVGLDPVLRRDLWQLFARLAAGGATLLVSSHVMDEATRCERLMLMRDGRIIADGTLADLLAQTSTSDAESAFLALADGGVEGAP